MEKQNDVIIIGAGLTGLTLAFYLQKQGKKVVLLDKMDRIGGVINTEHIDGFTFETGPNTGVLSSPELVTLFKDLEHRCELELANPDSKKRWIWKDGRWQALPSGLLEGISTKLFPFKDKLRVLGEPWRKKGANPNESVAELVTRRLGKSFLDYAVDPFISGIYAGDPEKLITRFALPKLYNLEQTYGSFIRGAIKKRKQVKSELEKQVTREVFSVKGGLKNLVQALADEVSTTNIKLGCENIKVNYIEPNNFELSYSYGDKKETLFGNNVVSTTGAYALSETMAFIPKKDLEAIANLKYAKVNQVVLGYNKWDGQKLDAFGGLVPSKEKRRILGVLFPSSIFPNRAPEGGALLTVFMGGVKNEEQNKLSDHKLKEIALDEIRISLGSDKAPDLIRLNRYNKAIAQYEVSSEQRLNQIDALEKKYTGLVLAGNIRGGIGMSDRVVQAVDVSKKL